jgi:hypothetical protein
MLGFLAYAAVPFALIALISYYYGKLMDKLEGRQQRQTRSRTGRLGPSGLTAAN